MKNQQLNIKELSSSIKKLRSWFNLRQKAQIMTQYSVCTTKK